MLEDVPKEHVFGDLVEIDAVYEGDDDFLHNFDLLEHGVVQVAQTDDQFNREALVDDVEFGWRVLIDVVVTEKHHEDL